jgi:tripartite-type tricarboxylate transporter receptor subunit TctC
MTRPVRRRLVAATLLASLTAPAPAPAQEAAGQALRVIIPQPPGGATDVLARLLSEPLSRALERPVVVENRPGANGIVAISALRQSRPDGGALLLGGVSIFSFNPNLYPSLPYDPWRDFTWIAPVADTPFVVGPDAGPASSPWRSSWSARAPDPRA